MVYDDELGDEDSGAQPDRFPFHEVELQVVASLCRLIRCRVSTMPPSSLRLAAALLLALERLPVPTPGVLMTFRLSQPNLDGNYSWVDGMIAEDTFELSLGTHFYDPGVGGDTESSTVFGSHVGSDHSVGDAEGWWEKAMFIANDAKLRFEELDDDIDWDLY